MLKLIREVKHATRYARMDMAASGLEADRVDQMKCYVCFYCCDGYLSEPKRVFWYRKDAIAWVKENENYRDYEEMEIE